MLTLMEFPNEILSSIIDATEPEDVVSFSTCCKTMYSLARRRLEEHKEKKRCFSKIFVNGDFLPFPGPLWPPEYGNRDDLQKVFSDERNRSYPKTVAVKIDLNEFGPMYDDSWSRIARIHASNGFDEFERQLKSRMAEVHSMIALVIGGIEAEEWAKDVKAGYPFAILMFLLALLPNLEECKIQTFTYWGHTLSANYSKIIRLMIEPALGQKKNGLSFGGRLTKCIIDGTFLGSIGESFLPFIMMLPKMRTIQGSGLYIQNGLWPFTDAVSPVVDLDLNGMIHSASLSNYVRGIKELKRFRYIFEDDLDMNGPEFDWEPSEIVATLRQSAFRSLVSLDLTIEHSHEMTWFDVSPGIGSLRSFEVLETVRLAYVLLLEEVLIADIADEVDSAETSEILDEESADGVDSAETSEILDEELADEVDSAETSEVLDEEPLVKGQRLIDFLPSSVRTFQLDDIAEVGLILETFDGFPEHRVEQLPKLHLITLDVADQTISQIEKICKETGVQITQNIFSFRQGMNG